MTQYNSVNMKFPNSQLKKLKSGIKNEITLNLSSNLVIIKTRLKFCINYNKFICKF